MWRVSGLRKILLKNNSFEYIYVFIIGAILVLGATERNIWVAECEQDAAMFIVNTGMLTPIRLPN